MSKLLKSKKKPAPPARGAREVDRPAWRFARHYARKIGTPTKQLFSCPLLGGQRGVIDAVKT
jgi:hypothetical protein